MSQSCCPTCGRAYPKAKVAKAADPVDTRAMPDAELIAYFKKIGLREDVRFFLRVADPIRPDLRAEAEALLAELERRPSKAADAKQLNRIRDTYRVEKPALMAEATS